MATDLGSASMLVLLLSGCALTGHSAPKSTMIDPASLVSSASVGAEMADAAWPSERWWTTFGDSQLDGLVQQAIDGSPSLRIALDRLRIAQAESEEANAGLRPKLNGSADIDREHISKAYIFPPPLGGGTGWSNIASLDFSYDLDLWGKTRSQLEGALAEDEAVRLDVRQSQLALTTAVVRTYVQFSLAYSVRDVAEATVRQRQSTLDITRRRLSAGITSQLEVSEAQAQVAPALVLVEQANETIDTLRNQLVALVGEGPAAAGAVQRPALKLEDATALPDVIPANLLGRRPDIVAARWRVRAAGKGIDVAKAQFYPDINLTAMVGLQSITMASFLTGDALTYGAGPAIRLPIFEGGKLRANLEGKNGNYDLAIDRYNQSVIDAFRDVANDIVSVRSLRKQRALAVTAVTDSQRAFDQASLGFKAGITDYLNVLATESALLLQRQNLVRIDAAGLDAKAQLTQALGGGFKDESDSDSAFWKAQTEHPHDTAPQLPSDTADDPVRFPSLKVHGH